MKERTTMAAAEESWWSIMSDADIVAVRQRGRQLAAQLGFSSSDQVLIATAISEITRNIVQHAGRGVLSFQAVRKGLRHGLHIVARDEGPGIVDVAQALEDGYSTGNGLGMGLPGSRRLMDEFDVVSAVGQGTIVTMTKWVP